MSKKVSIAAACFTGRRCGQASQALQGKLRGIWLLALAVGVLMLSSCATLGPQISYGGRGKIDLTESGVTSAQLSLEVNLDSTRQSTPVAAKNTSSFNR